MRVIAVSCRTSGPGPWLSVLPLASNQAEKQGADGVRTVGRSIRCIAVDRALSAHHALAQLAAAPPLQKAGIPRECRPFHSVVRDFAALRPRSEERRVGEE